MTSWNLKDPEEVKEYLANLETEYKFGCYKEKKPLVCHLLADYYESIKRNFNVAGQLYADNCDNANHGHSCFKYGNYCFLGKGGVKEDHERAMLYFEKGCTLKHPKSCLQAGLMKISGKSNILKDEKKALQHFDDGCELNEPSACYFYSAMFIDGIPNILAKDMTKACKYATKACSLGNAYACANLSQMYKKGDGVEQSDEKSAEYKAIALDIQDQNIKHSRTLEFGKGGV